MRRSRANTMYRAFAMTMPGIIWTVMTTSMSDVRAGTRSFASAYAAGVASRRVMTTVPSETMRLVTTLLPCVANVDRYPSRVNVVGKYDGSGLSSAPLGWNDALIIQ